MAGPSPRPSAVPAVVATNEGYGQERPGRLDDRTLSRVPIICRFNLVERVTHWSAAFCFLVTLLTGLFANFKGIALQERGNDPFAVLMRGNSILHHAAAWLFVLLLGAMLSLWAKQNIASRSDLRWLRVGVLRRAAPPAEGRYNARQKAFFWSVTSLTLACLISGLAITLSGTARSALTILHDGVGGALTLLIVAHGWALMRTPARTGMINGEVDLQWARAHYPRWVEQERNRILLDAQRAGSRGDWPKAQRLWDYLWDGFPEIFNHEARDMRGVIAMSLALDAAVEGTQPSAGMPNRTRESLISKDASKLCVDASLSLPNDRDLALAFESLGETCEFGMVQRQLGAEPLGLFRFAFVTLPNLISMLDCDLEGLGETQNMELQAASLEYVLRDRREFFTAHTWVAPGTVDEAKFFDQQCRRLRFLRTKLLEDLRSGEKTFVYRRERDLAVSDENIAELRRAVQRHGSNRLLVIRTEDADHPSGAVELRTDGVMLGYLGRDYCYPGWSKLSAADWRVVCRKAFMLQPTCISSGEREEVSNIFSEKPPTRAAE